MKFGPVPIDEAAGHVLGHNISGAGGRRVLRKGRPLSEEDVRLLRSLGRETVYVARLEPGDLDENTAAARIAEAVAGPEIRRSRATTGRVNFYAREIGILRVDKERLRRLNSAPSGSSANGVGAGLATLRADSAVRPGKMVATLKILPYALAGETARRLLDTAAGEEPTLRVTPIEPARIGVVLSGSLAARERIIQAYLGALGPRFEALGATVEAVEYVPLDDREDEARLAAGLEKLFGLGVDLLLLAGETAIQDRTDIVPRAIERAGGEITCYGAPVDPGNLLLLGRRQGVPILGAPGCARSAKRNIVDLVLPRLLAGDRLDADDLSAFGEGGLLEDTPERPAPRSLIS